MDAENWVNLFYFIAGLGIGLFQIWQSGRYREMDQQSRYQNIDNNIGEIRTQLAIISGVTSKLIDIDKAVGIIGASSGSREEWMRTMIEKQAFSDKATQMQQTVSSEMAQIAAEELGSASVTQEQLDAMEKRFGETLMGFYEEIKQMQNNQRTLPMMSENINKSRLGSRDGFNVKRAIIKELVRSFINSGNIQASHEVPALFAQYGIYELTTNEIQKAINSFKLSEPLGEKVNIFIDGDNDKLFIRLINKDLQAKMDS